MPQTVFPCMLIEVFEAFESPKSLTFSGLAVRSVHAYPRERDRERETCTQRCENAW